MELINDIIKSPYFAPITFLLGLIASTIFYLKSLKYKELRYILKTYNLIKDYSSRFSNLSIKYNGEEVKNFSVSKIIFWNNGKETIDGSDITKIEPLTISIGKDNKILDANIIQTNNQASQIAITEIKDNYLIINFEYLDYLNGVGINIIHNGLDLMDFKITGKIKGLRKIKEVSILNAPKEVHYLVPFPIHHDVSKYSPNKRRYLFGLSHVVTGTIFTAICVLGKLFADFFPKSNFLNESNHELPWLVVLLPGLLFILNGLYILLKRIPKGLDVYEDL